MKEQIDEIDEITEKLTITSVKNLNLESPVGPEVPEKEEDSVLIARLLQEMQQLRQENRKLTGEIEGERQARQELETAKNGLTAEIEELTKTLFEEANGMVASEAQARWTLEQSHARLETELQKTRELLSLETEQTRILRGIMEEEKSSQRLSDPVLWDVDVFAARLAPEPSYDDFFPVERGFDSRAHSAAHHWEALSTRTLDTPQFQAFSHFMDECFRVSVRTRDTQLLTDEAVLTVLGHEFMRNCLQADIEPCLAFPVLERNGKTKSLLKKLIPAMLKNNCLIEPLMNSTALSSLPSPESIRASPLSIRSFISIAAPPTRSKASSPVKSPSKAVNIPGTPSVDPFLLPTGSPASVTSIESCPVSPTASASLRKCSMCDCSGKDSHRLIPTHRFRICSNSANSASNSSSPPQWNLICRACRNRLVSVASFFTILRHLLQGLHSHRPKLDVYFDFMHAKRHMFYTRVGVEPAFYALSDFEAFSTKINIE